MNTLYTLLECCKRPAHSIVELSNTLCLQEGGIAKKARMLSEPVRVDKDRLQRKLAGYGLQHSLSDTEPDLYVWVGEPLFGKKLSHLHLTVVHEDREFLILHPGGRLSFRNAPGNNNDSANSFYWSRDYRGDLLDNFEELKMEWRTNCGQWVTAPGRSPEEVNKYLKCWLALLEAMQGVEEELISGS